MKWYEQWYAVPALFLIIMPIVVALIIATAPVRHQERGVVVEVTYHAPRDLAYPFFLIIQRHHVPGGWMAKVRLDSGEVVSIPFWEGKQAEPKVGDVITLTSAFSRFSGKRLFIDPLP